MEEAMEAATTEHSVETPSAERDTQEPTLLLSNKQVRRHRGPQRKTARNEAFAAAYNAGASREELADMFGLRPSTVEQYLVKFRRWGLITRPTAISQRSSSKTERNAAIVTAHRGGTPVALLAKAYELSPMQVRNILHEAAARERSQVDVDPWVHVSIHLSVVEDIVQHGTEALLLHQREVLAALKSARASHQTQMV